MATTLRSSVFWMGLFLANLYWVAVLLVNPTALLEVVRTLQVAIGFVVVGAYFASAWFAIKSGKPDRVAQLTLGICLGFLATSGLGIWILVWRLGGQPTWMMNHPLYGFGVWLYILAGVLHTTAPGAIDGVIPKKNWLKLSYGIAAGVGAAIVVQLLELDLSPFTAWMETWLVWH